MSRLISDLRSPCRELCEKFLTNALAMGYSISVTNTLRTMFEQEELYAMGRTKPGKVVTNAKPGQSAHNYGLAFDIAFGQGKDITWAEPHRGAWEELGNMGETLGLAWGGHFKSVHDAPHFEVSNWKEMV